MKEWFERGFGVALGVGLASAMMAAVAYTVITLLRMFGP